MRFGAYGGKFSFSLRERMLQAAGRNGGAEEMEVDLPIKTESHFGSD